MYPTGAAEVVIIVLFLWLATISYLFWKERKFLNQLFPKNQRREGIQEAALLLRNQYKALTEEIDEVKRRDQTLSRNFRDLAKIGLQHIQRVEVLRYNPYGDTGGDQSFSAVFLNGKFDGLVFTSLHSRAGTRIYAKPIIGGKSEIELSKEEKEVIGRATEN